MSTETGLPAGLAERLQRLADTGTAGSRPWPQLDEHLHRAHRRRVQLVTVVATLLVVATIGLGSLFVPGALDSQRQTPASKDFSAVVERYPELKKAGYTAPTGGNLGQDQAWLAGLRAQTVRVAGRLDPQNYTYHLVARDVLVLWAGDLGGTRYASVMYPDAVHGFGDDTSWDQLMLAGPAGADGAAMRRVGVRAALGDGSVAEPRGSFVTGPGGATVLAVTAPGADRVELATGRRFFPDGTSTTSWRRLSMHGGSGTVVPASKSEQALSTFRVDGAEALGADPADEQRGPDLDAVTPDSSDADLVREAGSQLMNDQGTTSAERPVIGRSTDLGADDELAVAVLRSPDGGYLYGFAKRGASATTYVTAPGDRGFTSPDQAMTALPSPMLSYTPDTRTYLVLAPAGATSVRSGAVTATVRDRLAVLTLPGAFAPEGDRNRIDVQALDTHGALVATARSLPHSIEGSAS